MKYWFLVLCLIISFSSFSKEKIVVTSFYPMYIVTLNVMSGVKDIKLVNMTKPFVGCLHDYQLTPADLVTLSKADVFIVNGGGMESFIEKILKQQKDLTIIDASKDISLLEGNPHVWLSPALASIQVENIAKGLSLKFSEKKDLFEKNSKEYIAKLLELNRKMKTELKNLKSRSIITFHEAFPYFAKEFDLEIAAVIEREPGSEPTAKEFAGIIKKLKSLKTKVIFAEPQYSTKSAEAIAKESGAKIYSLDPLVIGEFDKDAYLKGMGKNLGVLKEALK